MPQPRQRSPLYLLDAFGWSEWNVWALQDGGLSEWCPACYGRGFTVARSCIWRERNDPEFMAEFHGTPCPGALTGCDNERWPCRATCRDCKGARLRKPDAVRAEDFGDTESLDTALAMFPGLVVCEEKRSDMEANAL
jgi:hypothetical protein